jgi:hypothetical protein
MTDALSDGVVLNREQLVTTMPICLGLTLVLFSRSLMAE